MSGFRVAHAHQAHIRQFRHSVVIHSDGNYIVFARSDAQRLREVLPVDEVREYEGNAALRDGSDQIFQAYAKIRAPRLRCKRKQFADNI